MAPSSASLRRRPTADVLEKEIEGLRDKIASAASDAAKQVLEEKKYGILALPRIPSELQDQIRERHQDIAADTSRAR